MSLVVPVPHLREYKGAGFQYSKKTDLNQVDGTLYTADSYFDFWLTDIIMSSRNDIATPKVVSIIVRDPAPVYKTGINFYLGPSSYNTYHVGLATPIMVRAGWEIIATGMTTNMYCYITLVGIKDRLSVG
jgi:hypothetical protein